MTRPTILDLAKEAGVSISTVDRVLSGRARVRRQTAQAVLDAAERIGFYSTGAIRDRIGGRKPDVRLGFLLQQSGRPFYANLAASIERASRDCHFANVTSLIEHMDDISPDAVSRRMLEAGNNCDVLAVVAAEHPMIAQTIEKLAGQGVACFGLVAGISAPNGTGYVGLDHWKVGRTAGWAFANICSRPGKLAIMVGSHRFRNQELNESGFRSYLREHAPHYELLEPMITYEDKRVAAELTRTLLSREPDVVGLYVSGGGISGVLQALREAGAGEKVVTVGYELMEETRNGIIDGTLNFIISHPLERIASAAVTAMAHVASSPVKNGTLPNVILPFDIYTPENI